MRAASQAAAEQQNSRDEELLRVVAGKVSPDKLVEMLRSIEVRSPPPRDDAIRSTARTSPAQSVAVVSPRPGTPIKSTLADKHRVSGSARRRRSSSSERRKGSHGSSDGSGRKEVAAAYTAAVDTCDVRSDVGGDDRGQNAGLQAAFDAEVSARMESDAQRHRVEGQVEVLRLAHQELLSQNRSLREEVTRLREANRHLTMQLESRSQEQHPTARSGGSSPTKSRQRHSLDADSGDIGSSRGMSGAREHRTVEPLDGDAIHFGARIRNGRDRARSCDRVHGVGSGSLEDRGREDAERRGVREYDHRDVERARQVILQKVMRIRRHVLPGVKHT